MSDKRDVNKLVLEAVVRAQANEPAQNFFRPQPSEGPPIKVIFDRGIPATSDVATWVQRVKETIARRLLNFDQACMGAFANYQGTTGGLRYETWSTSAKAIHREKFKSLLVDDSFITSAVTFCLRCARSWSADSMARFVIVKAGEAALVATYPELVAGEVAPAPEAPTVEAPVATIEPAVAAERQVSPVEGAVKVLKMSAYKRRQPDMTNIESQIAAQVSGAE